MACPVSMGFRVWRHLAVTVTHEDRVVLLPGSLQSDTAEPRALSTLVHRAARSQCRRVIVPSEASPLRSVCLRSEASLPRQTASPRGTALAAVTVVFHA